MRTNKGILAAALFAVLAATAFGQIKRTTYKADRLEFSPGGSLAIMGAPNGSIKIEGWANREVEISAEIEMQAATAADLDRIAKVTGFVMSESTGKIDIMSVGPNDKKYLRSVDKKFPKELLNTPFTINYTIKVPKYCDLTVDGGKGALQISGVEGSLKVNYLESDAVIDLVGGGVLATIGKGTLNLSIPSRSWRGHFADVQVASGDLNLKLPAGLNADFDASILRSGKIENDFPDFKPRVRKQEFTEKSIVARSGTGGVPLKFAVGDGTMKIVMFGKNI